MYVCECLSCSSIVFKSIFFYFFQAEDGIRDGHVTGVQTCALPISFRMDDDATLRDRSGPRSGAVARDEGDTCCAGRSEERRVGKECGIQRRECLQYRRERCISVTELLRLGGYDVSIYIIIYAIYVE